MDGERNFKAKMALPNSQTDLAGLVEAKGLRVFAPMPTADLYDFNGSLEFDFNGSDGVAQAERIDNNQFVPRGSVIKNSGEVAAMVLYTGQETKLMMNLGSYTFKRSQMEKRVGNLMIANLCALFVFIVITVLVNAFLTKELFETHFYITDGSDTTATEATLQSIISFYLLFNYLIPLDLAVMLEFNVLFYISYIGWDANMTYYNTQMGRVDGPKMNTLNLIENLGEVEYIMSDKTGTLTQNELTFVAACCSPSSYHLFGATIEDGSAA